jgi:hypothetical protein
MSIRLEDITNRIVSASATVIAVIALATGVYQSKLMHDQSKASVLPYLIQGNAGDHGYSRIIQNVGIGPAMIRAFEVRVDSHIVKSWREAADSLHLTLSWRGHSTTTFVPGLLVPAGTRMDLLNLADSSDIHAFRAAIREGRLETWVCFCSVFDDCWANRSGAYVPNPVKACKEDRSRRFLE